LVYSVMPNHPLNLHPGDIILGYDGVPWKQLVKELFEAELPALGGGSFASTPVGSDHTIMADVGANWGLFDTIDVLKYPTNDTLHLPTSFLQSITPPYFNATEELPVAGVAFPDLQASKLVSWGVVEGTNIGYVYAWDWSGVPDGNTRTQFAQAIDDLMHTRNVTGLILDFRTNAGGWEHYANEGFKHLFNFDPTNNYARAWRVQGNDHFSFSIRTAYAPDFFTPTPEIFDHPIAVLTGPHCGSAGDYNAFRLRFHPMVRFFGKPTAGAYTDLDENPFFTSNGYLCRVDPACVYSNVNGEAYMIHKTFPVDEVVWLTREGVAKGEDDVVKRALQWVNTLSYAHDVKLSRLTVDTVRVEGRVTNPLAHTLHLALTLRDGAGAPLDSVTLVGDSLWTYRYAPRADGTIRATVRVDDITTGTSRMLADAAQLVFSRGPSITMDTRNVSLGDVGTGLPRYDTSFVVKNTGLSADSLTVSLDPGNVVPDTAVFVSPRMFKIAAGDSQKVTFGILPSLLSPQYYAAQVRVKSWRSLNQPLFLKDYLFHVVITGVASDRPGLPTEFVLGQNYPNPFNPSTSIEYTVAGTGHEALGTSWVRLAMYDMLGREVAVLVDGKKEAGSYEVKFDASALSSGVYFYRIQIRPLDSAIGRDSKGGAGGFAETKRMVLIK
jgi:hypothetical protein